MKTLLGQLKRNIKVQRLGGSQQMFFRILMSAIIIGLQAVLMGHCFYMQRDICRQWYEILTILPKEKKEIRKLLIRYMEQVIWTKGMAGMVIFIMGNAYGMALAECMNTCIWLFTANLAIVFFRKYLKNEVYHEIVYAFVLLGLLFMGAVQSVAYLFGDTKMVYIGMEITVALFCFVCYLILHNRNRERIEEMYMG